MTTGRINQVELDNNKRPVGVAIVRVCVLAGGRGGAPARSTQQRARACSLALFSALHFSAFRRIGPRTLAGIGKEGGPMLDGFFHHRLFSLRVRRTQGWERTSVAGPEQRPRQAPTRARALHRLSLFSPSSFGRSEEGSEGRQVARVGGGAGAHGRQAPHQGCPPIPPPRQLPAAPPLSFLPPSHAERAGPPLSTGELARALRRGALGAPSSPDPFPGNSEPAGSPARPASPARARARERAKARGMGDAGYPPRPVGIGWKRNTRSKREPQRGGPSGPAFTPRKAARGV